MADAIHLIAPFPTKEGLRGPDLARPRPELRIVPGRLSGSPHVVHAPRNASPFSLDVDGLDALAIKALYPYVTDKQLAEAIDLERQLQANLDVRDAASCDAADQVAVGRMVHLPAAGVQRRYADANSRDR